MLVLAVAFATVGCNNNGGNEAAVNADSTSANVFGNKIDDAGAIPVENLVAMASEGNIPSENIKITGKVDEVCQAKGCWLSMVKPDGSKMRVTFKDYAFFVPKDCSGKTAVMEGRAFMDTTSVEDLQHYAKDAGKSEEEIAKITSPEIELAFEAEGVIIK